MCTAVSRPGIDENPEYPDQMGSNMLKKTHACTHTGTTKLQRSASEADPEM